MKRFKTIDHTADIGIVAYGSDLNEAFANAAYGMFSLIADLDSIRESLHLDIEVEASDNEALVVDWLNELLYIFDVEHVIFSRFEIVHLNEKRLQARAYGEKIDLSRHRLKRGVKAATYHMLKIERENGFSIRVILDI